MATFFSSIYTQPNQDTRNDTKATTNRNDPQPSSSYFSLGFSSAFGDVVGRFGRGWKGGGSHDEVSRRGGGGMPGGFDSTDEDPTDPALLASKIHDLILNSPLMDSSNPLSPLASSGYTPLPAEHGEFGDDPGSPAPAPSPEPGASIGTFQPPQAFNFPVSPPAPNSTSLPHAGDAPGDDARIFAVLSSPLVMNGEFTSFASFGEEVMKSQAPAQAPLSPPPKVPGSFGEEEAPVAGPSSLSPPPQLQSPGHRSRKISVFDVLESMPSPFASPPPRSPLGLNPSILPSDLRGVSSPMVSPERDKFSGWGSFGDFSAGPSGKLQGQDIDEEEEQLPDEGSSFMLYSPLVPTPHSMVEIAESGIVEEPDDDIPASIPRPGAVAAQTRRWYWPFGTGDPSAPTTTLATTPGEFSPASVVGTPAPAYSRHPLPLSPAPRRRPRVWLPSKTELSIQALWWGYRIYLPPPVMAALSSSRSPLQSFSHQATVLTTSLTWFLSNLPLSVLPFQVRPVVALLQLLVPYIGYIGGFVGWSWGRVKGYDEGHGVILTATWLLPVALIPSTWYPTDFPPASPSPLIQSRPLPSIAAVLSGGDNTEENARLLGSPPPNYISEPTTPIYASPAPIHTSIHPLDSGARNQDDWPGSPERSVNGTAVYMTPAMASSPLPGSIYASPMQMAFSPTHAPVSPHTQHMLSPIGHMFSPPPPSPLLRLSPLPSAPQVNLPSAEAGAMNPWTLATPLVNNMSASLAPEPATQPRSPPPATSPASSSTFERRAHPPPPQPRFSFYEQPNLFSPIQHSSYLPGSTTLPPPQLPMVDPYAYLATPDTVFGRSPSPSPGPSPVIGLYTGQYQHPQSLSPIRENPSSPLMMSPVMGMPGGMPGTPIHHSVQTTPATIIGYAPGSPVPPTPSTVYGTPLPQADQPLQSHSPFINYPPNMNMAGVWGTNSPWGGWGGGNLPPAGGGTVEAPAMSPPSTAGRRVVDLPSEEVRSEGRSSRAAAGASRTRTWDVGEDERAQYSRSASAPSTPASMTPKPRKSKTSSQDGKKAKRRSGDDPGSGMVIVGSPSTSTSTSASRSRSSLSQAGPHILTAASTPSLASTTSAQVIASNSAAVKRSKSKLVGSISGITESFGRALKLERRKSGSRNSDE